MTETTTSERKIPTRRISFKSSLKDLPRHFAADEDLIGSHVVAALSAVFPDGEDFFVRSVRHFRDQISDPQLKRQVAGFIGQEAMHGREHRVLNERLSELGYPSKRVERFTRAGLRVRTRVLSAKSNLAATAALEHFTATLAELVMDNDEVRNMIGHEEVKNLFLWHALEESEHKAVAFDVYKAVGGSERIRVWTMNLMTFGFVFGMTVQVVLSLLSDRDTYRRKNLRRSWRRFKSSPVMQPEVWRRLRDYNRTDFHPDDHDATKLVTHWREELFGESGYLNDKLTKSVA
jgi:predicted metal-dependent hydrolase